MARWRAEALWIELQFAFEKAYRADPPDEAMIARIYSFADWCVQAPRGPDAGHDPMTAVTVAFYEHIPNFKPAREDMPRWFRYSEVTNNWQVFSYHLGDEEFDALLKHMAKNQHRHQPRPTAEL